MCEYSSQDGFATDWHLVHLGARAQEEQVSSSSKPPPSPGRPHHPGDLGIWKDEHIPNLQRIAQFLHSQGIRAGIQLAHAGRKASMSVPFTGERLLSPEEGGWQPVAPAPSPSRPLTPFPGSRPGRHRRHH